MGNYFKQVVKGWPAKLLGLLCALAMSLTTLGIVAARQARADTPVQVTCAPSRELPSGAPAAVGSYCWIDFHNLDVDKAQQPGGQPMSLQLPDGSTMTFTAHVATQIDGHWKLSPQEMDSDGYSGKYFSDVPGQPLIHMQTVAWLDTEFAYNVSLDDISVSGDGKSGYSIGMIGKGLEFGHKLSLQYSSSSPISELFGIPADDPMNCPAQDWGGDSVTCTNDSGEGEKIVPLAVTSQPKHVSMTVRKANPVGSSTVDIGMTFAVSTRSMKVSNSVSVPKGAVAGTKETYTITAKNDSATAFESVTMSPKEFSGLENKPDFSGAQCVVTDQDGHKTTVENGNIMLPAKSSASCSADAVISQADAAAGAKGHFLGMASVPNAGSKPSEYYSSTESTIEVDSDLHAALGIGQQATLADHPTDPVTTVAYNDQVNFAANLTNTGKSRLTDVKVTEGNFSGEDYFTRPDFTNVKCNTYSSNGASQSFVNGKIVMEPGDRVKCVASAYIVTLGDTKAGHIVNEVSATGTDVNGQPVQAQSEDGKDLSSLSLKVKPYTAALLASVSSNYDGKGPVPVGSKVQYTMRVKNTGASEVTAVQLSNQAFSGSGTKPVPDKCLVNGKVVKNGQIVLEPGQSADCQTNPLDYTVNSHDVSTGELSYTVVAAGDSGSAGHVKSNSATDKLPLKQQDSALQVGLVSDQDGKVVTVGDKVTYTLTTENTGRTVVKQVKLAGDDFSGHGPRPQFDDVTCAVVSADGKTSSVKNGSVTLSPGDKVSCQAQKPYTVTAADGQAKKLTYHAVSHGVAPDGQPVTATAKDGSTSAVDSLVVKEKAKVLVLIYRLYNHNTGEHFYTASGGERDALKRAGWSYEGTLESAPATGQPIYRVYNPNAAGGDHYYTTSRAEAAGLVGKGWKWDNNAQPVFYSGGTVPVYVAYNPNASAGAHNYTTNRGEQENLTRHGWKYGAVAWYAGAPGAGA